MAADDDEVELPEDVLADDEPSSGPRPSYTPDEYLLLALAEFRRRSKGLTGDALQREVDHLVDRIVERNAKSLPGGLRDEARRVVRQMLESDPAMRAILGDLRDAAARR